MLRYGDITHDAALLAYEERLAKSLADDAVRRAIAESAAVDDGRSAPQPQPRRRLPRAVPVFHPHRRVASLLR